ncbi:MAG: ComF family protein [Planctomycetota bacterium]|jgi:ComF family protein
MIFVRKIIEHLSNFVNLVYPNYCVLCQSNLHQNEATICTICEVKLPYTNYHKSIDNPIEKKLWGRVPIQKASSLLFFEKGLEVQQLISNLKYKNREDIGAKLAEIYARHLIRDQSEFLKVDLLIPIPLHYKKQKRRGYNQCDSFTITLSEQLNIPFDLKSIERKVDTISQTGKSRIKRWENVSEIFKVTNLDKLKNKHILLIDDVMTTGATLEALANKILAIEGTQVSVLVMASAV